MQANNEDLNGSDEKDRIRVQISLGLITIYSGFFFLIKSYASLNGGVLNIYLSFILHGVYSISAALFFFYILLTALHYKTKNPNYVDEYYFPEKFRGAVYDLSINSLIGGFFYSIVYAIIESLRNSGIPYVTSIIIGIVIGGGIILILALGHFFLIEKKFK